MDAHLDELKALARDFIPADEEIRAAADVGYGGKVNLTQASTGMAALGHHDAQTAAGEALAARLGDEPIVSFPSAKQMALVLTAGRLLVWSRGGFKGKPKAFIGEVPLGSIASVDVEPRRTGDRLTINMRSGWQITLDVLIERADPGFGPTLAVAVGDSAAPSGVTLEAVSDSTEDADGDSDSA